MSSLSSNNVIYGFQVAYDEKNQEAVIDSNEKAKALIGKEEKAYKDKLLEEERARRLKEMEESGVEIPEGMDPDEFLGLADTITGANEEKEPDVDYVAEAQAEAERILSEAKAQAEEIIESAKTNGEALKTIAANDGRTEGYNEGTQRAAMELQTAKDKMEAEISRVTEEFQQKSLTLEHDMVEMCLPVFEKVFMAQLSGRKDVLFHLLDQCIMKIERSKQIQIKVSEGNADFIKSKLGELEKRVGSDVNFDVISDPVLDDNACLIETDGGVFDCSIDTELDALLRAIKALS